MNKMIKTVSQIATVFILFFGTLAISGFLFMVAGAAHLGLSLISGLFALLACLMLLVVHYFCYKHFTVSTKQLLILSIAVLFVLSGFLILSIPTLIKENNIKKKINLYNARYSLKNIKSTLTSEGYQTVQNITQVDLDNLVGKWGANNDVNDLQGIGTFTIVKAGDSYYLDNYTYSKMPFDKINLEQVSYDIQYQKFIWRKLEVKGDMILVGSDAYLFLTDKGLFYLQIHEYPDYPDNTWYDHGLLIKKH